MKYIVLKAKSTFDLEKVVNLHIESGWMPTGGVVVQGRNHYLYYQAMIKHVD
ncbi:DUF1737 domain-containing protein [Leuconostoc mesenteroides]|uniref:DUF1737 domain-containing protein n=1 Tax=Leuconostoc mesenteroides TaxID=1245 RepID=UPI0027304DDB|nr:DUF1737 domain-containing protein [Leuconostoc mesenteroides]MDP0487159.1 DUF1737 domain-containing protein [Leuconostoc mesenteroides]